MKQITLVFVMLGFAGSLSPAQYSVSVSGGTGLSSIPRRLGNAHVSFLSTYALTSELDLGLSIGFQHFLPSGPSNQYTNVIPLTFEMRYKLESEGIRPYAQLELGAAQVESKFTEHYLYPIDFFEYAPDQPYPRKQKQWFPMVSLGVGAFFPLTNLFSLDLGLRLGVVAGGGVTSQTLVYGRVPDTIPIYQSNADEWNYLRLVVGIRTEL